MPQSDASCDISIPGVRLQGELRVPDEPRGIVVFAHGSGSSRHSPRNQWVADYLRQHSLGTLLFDLLSADEERVDRITAEYRFDIELLAGRLVDVSDWLLEREAAATSIGYFGSSTGAAAALVAATRTNQTIAAIVSRGGRPDLAGDALYSVASPTQFIVGANDPEVLSLNRAALKCLACEKELVVIDGATHLFEEPGTLADAASHARRWFVSHFPQ